MRTPYSVARLAQSVEHETLNLRVVGSSPTSGASFFFFFFLSFFLLFSSLTVLHGFFSLPSFFSHLSNSYLEFWGFSPSRNDFWNTIKHISPSLQLLGSIVVLGILQYLRQGGDDLPLHSYWCYTRHFQKLRAEVLGGEAAKSTGP